MCAAWRLRPTEEIHHPWCCLLLTQRCEVGRAGMIIWILQRRKWRPMKVKWLPQRHTTCKWPIRDFKWGLLITSLTLWCFSLCDVANRLFLCAKLSLWITKRTWKRSYIILPQIECMCLARSYSEIAKQTTNSWLWVAIWDHELHEGSSHAWPALYPSTCASIWHSKHLWR